MTIPYLIRSLGTDRFGVLTLAWSLIGYFSLFDFGLGRTLTQVVAEKLGTGREQDVPVVLWTGLMLLIALGLVGLLAGAMLTPWIVQRVLRIPTSLVPETITAFLILALSVPATITTTGLRGALEAYHRFGVTSGLRAAMGIFTFLAPVLVIPFSRSLVSIVAVLLAGRVLALVAHAVVCRDFMKEQEGGLGITVTVNPALIGPLLRAGGWMTVSNLISPLMVTMDRFLIGSMVSLTAVAYYVTPFDVVTRLLIIPGAMATVVFPAFAATYKRDSGHSSILFSRAVRSLLVVLFPTVVTIILFARPGLEFWLGSDFARHSTRVSQWLAVGVLANGLGTLAFAAVQGAGRPDLTAKFHLVELPIYVIALTVLVRHYGIDGAAIAWTLRVSLDTTLLFACLRSTIFTGSIPRFA
jgi:O-antigen/teichoic acid export membrane protein